MLLQGIYRLHLNGNPVGDSHFNPGWTDYARRLYFDAWDVTALLRPGTNALGAVVADGWYAGAPASPDRQLSTPYPHAVGPLALSYPRCATCGAVSSWCGVVLCIHACLRLASWLQLPLAQCRDCTGHKTVPGKVL